MDTARTRFHTLHTLSSLDGSQIDALRDLGIQNLADLLAYQPFRYARYLRAADDNILRREEVIGYVDAAARGRTLAEILRSATSVLRGVGRQEAAIHRRLGLRSVADMAAFSAVEEAEGIVTNVPDDEKDPFAPAGLLPTFKKFSKNTKTFASFFKEREIRDLRVRSSDRSAVANLFNFGAAETKVIYLGYSVNYLQEWIFQGVHLGEPQGSVNLSMTQDSQVSVLDWRRAMRSLRTEDSRVSEKLASALFHQRAVDEVARATAEEHQYGATSAFGANAATAGSFVAAGAVVGGIGGGISGGLVGLSVDALAGGTTMGLGTLSGAVVGSAVGAAAGSAAGSIIASGATTLGFVDTDAEGDRAIVADSAQRIQQRTVQNSSSIRSFWSNIVQQSVEEERQQIRTDRVTNHNRIHALNAILFEVLNAYRINLIPQSSAPILFVPFKPFKFDPDLLRRYWWLIRASLVDKTLVKLLDDRYLRLGGAPNMTDRLEALPEASDVVVSRVTVTINMGGSKMADMMTNIGAAALGLPVAAAVFLFRQLFDEQKRRNISASLLTTDGPRLLLRESVDGDENYAWTFSTESAIRVADITGIRITNDNSEFDLGKTDLNALGFDDIRAVLTLRNRAGILAAVPNIRTLEDRQIIAEDFTVGANSSRDFGWNIGDRLRSLFEGIESARDALQQEQLAIDNADQAERSLLDFLSANRYTFTRLILQNIEPEQVMNALEDVQIGDVDLTDIAGTTPIGFCANHVVLPMKACTIKGASRLGIGLDTLGLEAVLEAFERLDGRKPSDIAAYLTALSDFLKGFVQSAAGSGNGSLQEDRLLDAVNDLRRLLAQALKLIAASSGGRLSGVAAATGRQPPTVAAKVAALMGRLGDSIRKILSLLRSAVKVNAQAVDLLCGYHNSVKASLKDVMGTLMQSDEVSLPSPALFMEPMLSHSKGAELYDMRRNSHYALLESPGIAASDPNVLRAQPTSLTPNVPAASLSLLAPPELPLPGGLEAALSQAGKLDLSTLLQSNAGSVGTLVTTMANLSTEFAKVSASLTGDAQTQALAAASDMAKRVGDIVGRSVQAPSPSSQPSAPPQPPTPSPRTQQEKREVYREAERIDRGSGTQRQKDERKRTIGAATTADDKRDYRFSFAFVDENGVPYPDPSFTYTLKMQIFELGKEISINGGAPIRISEDPLLEDVFPLTKGRRVRFTFIADVNGLLIPSGPIDVLLGESPDIAIICTMRSETAQITATSGKEAMETKISTSGFKAGLRVLLERFLNAGATFPFKLTEATVNGGVKGVIDLMGEYAASTTSNAANTSTTGTTTVYQVTTPINAWGHAVIGAAS